MFTERVEKSKTKPCFYLKGWELPPELYQFTWCPSFDLGLHHNHPGPLGLFNLWTVTSALIYLYVHLSIHPLQSLVMSQWGEMWGWKSQKCCMSHPGSGKPCAPLLHPNTLSSSSSLFSHWPSYSPSQWVDRKSISSCNELHDQCVWCVCLCTPCQLK